MSNDKQSYKITDEQFLELFLENKGNCTLTAKAIEEKYGITYSRQAVYLRAKNLSTDEIVNILVLFDDLCEARLIKFADDEGNNINLRTRIYIHMRNKLYKQLTAITRQSVQPQKPEQVYKIGEHIIRFNEGADNSEAFAALRNKKTP